MSERERGRERARERGGREVMIDTTLWRGREKEREERGG